MNSTQDLKIELKSLKMKQKELTKAIKATEDYSKRAEVIERVKEITKALTETPEPASEVAPVENQSVVLPTPAYTNNPPKKGKAPKLEKK